MYHPGTGGSCLGALITYQSSCKRPHAHSTDDCSYNSSVFKTFFFKPMSCRADIGRFSTEVPKRDLFAKHFKSAKYLKNVYEVFMTNTEPRPSPSTPRHQRAIEEANAKGSVVFFLRSRSCDACRHKTCMDWMHDAWIQACIQHTQPVFMYRAVLSQL